MCHTTKFLDQILSILLKKDHLGFKHLASNMAVLNLSLRLEYGYLGSKVKTSLKLLEKNLFT